MRRDPLVLSVVLVLAVFVGACSDDRPSLPRQVDDASPPPTLLIGDDTSEEIPRELADELTRDVLDAYAEPRTEIEVRLGPAGNYIDAPVVEFDLERGREILELLASGDEARVRTVLTGPLLDAAPDFAVAFSEVDGEFEFAGGVLPITPDGAAALVELTVGDESDLHNIGFRFVEGQWYAETFR